MKLRQEQLAAQLQRQLAPIYLIASDEPLLQQECLDQICQYARAQGYAETVSINDAGGVDWQDFLDNTQAGSLFSHQQILLLRLKEAKPGNTGAKALQQYTEQIPTDKLLIILTSKLDASAQKSRWFSRVDKVGITLILWPINQQQMPQWIKQRLAAKNLQTDDRGLQLLAERTEGNLLAGAQEIEKLSILYEQGHISAEQIAEAVTDSTHFNIFALVDACLLGDAKRCQQILDHLHATGEAANLVLWALCRCLRQLSQLSADQAANIPLPQAMQQQRIWRDQQALFQRALAQHPPAHWHRLLSIAADIDLMCKGAIHGAPWDALLQLSLAIHAKSPLLDELNT